MNARTAIATLAVLAALTLTGCAGAADNAGDERTAPEPTESAVPLAAETPTESAAPAVSDEDARFLAYVRDNLLPETQIPNATDEQLIEAGHEACRQLESGVALEDVRVVEGEKPHANGNYYDSSTIRSGARIAYCPDAG